MFDELGKLLTPHVHRLNENIAIQGALLHNKLEKIEANTSNAARAGFGDKWFRVNFKQNVAANEIVDIATVPSNEIWPIQSLIVDGVVNLSPNFLLLSGGSMIGSVIAKGVGQENYGGDAVCLAGEKIQIATRAESGVISLTLCVLRRPIPVTPMVAQHGKSNELLSPINTHSVGRDVIHSRTDQYTETPNNVPGILEIGDSLVPRGAESGLDAGGMSDGNPVGALIDPTSV